MARRLRDKDVGWKDVVGMPDALYIQLTQGKMALIDREDLPKVSSISWHYSNGYARSDSKHDKVYMHKLLNRTPEGLVTDHINGNKLDNRKSNLRSATLAQNSYNAKGVGNSSSKFKGVCLIKSTGKWRARIMVDRKEIHLGVFNSESDARMSYVAAAEYYQGKFARVQ